jgi:hypothetical protein
MQEVLMKRKSFIYSVIFLASLGCAHEWQNPNTTLPAQELDIISILANPIAYDSAGVIVEGKVWDLVFDTLEEDDKESPYTNFKLADRDGNFVNVFALGHLPITEGDFVKVVGIYRRELSTGSYNFINEIEAKRVEGEEK